MTFQMSLKEFKLCQIHSHLLRAVLIISTITIRLTWLVTLGVVTLISRFTIDVRGTGIMTV